MKKDKISLPDFKMKLNELIGVGELVFAFNLAKLHLAESSSKRNELILVAGNYFRLLKEDSIGTITQEEKSVHSARAQKSLIELINGMDENDDFSAYPIDRKGIKNKIVTISLGKEEKEQLHAHLNPVFFHDCEPMFPNELPTSNQDEDIVIFNASHIKETIDSERNFKKLSEPQQRWLGNLEKIIQDTNHLVLFYGDQYYRLADWRDRVHAANSPFTLYSRLKEISEFIEINRK